MTKTYTIEYNAATTEPNNIQKDGNPYLCLNAVVNKRNVTVKGGVMKWKAIRAELDTMNESLANHKGDTPFKYPLTLQQKGFIVSEPMLDMFNHFKADIDAYIEKYFKPPARECVTEPTKKEELFGLDVIQYLLIPTYPKNDWDHGEGFGAWKLTPKAAKFWCNGAFPDQDPYEVIQKWMEENPETTLTLDLVAQDGHKYQRSLDHYQQMAFINYFNNIMRWGMNA